MQQDLIKAYKSFLLSSVRVFFVGENIIQSEIDFYTKNFLKDGLLFFICAFDKINAKMLKKVVFKDLDAFKEYVLFEDDRVVLSSKGEELKFYIEQKLASQALMLEFNGVKPEHVGKVTTILKRFEKFWQIILGFSKKRIIDK